MVGSAIGRFGPLVGCAGGIEIGVELGAVELLDLVDDDESGGGTGGLGFSSTMILGGTDTVEVTSAVAVVVDWRIVVEAGEAVKPNPGFEKAGFPGSGRKLGSPGGLENGGPGLNGGPSPSSSDSGSLSGSESSTPCLAYRASKSSRSSTYLGRGRLPP